MATAEARLGSAGTLPPFRIRPADLGDVDAVAAIEATAFSNPWHPQTIRSIVAQGRARVLVGEDPSEGVVGYAVIWWVLDQGELANLAVKENYRGRGLGSALLEQAMAEARDNQVKSLFLEVRESNRAAQNLYLARGFVQVAVRRDYYRNPREDALVLLKTLTD
jgi:ribosomal-protein-alanine N-acetyltransferase